MRNKLLAVATAAAIVAAAAPGHARPEAVTAPGVKPGLTYTSPEGGCSFAFLFRGSDGRDYVSTAGHCVLDAGRKVWARGDGPRVTDDDGRQVGNFVYASFVDDADYAKTTDLAFIRLDRGLRGDPQMCAWGGPTRLLTEAVTRRTELHHNGGGLALGDTVPSRTAYAESLPRRHRLLALGAVTFGDSGSGTTTADGAAVGINVTIEPAIVGGHVGDGFAVSTMGMQRLDLAVADAAKALRVRLTLRTAPLLPTPLPVERC